MKAPRARGARSPHTRDDFRRVVERIGAGGFEEDEEGGDLPSVGAIVDAHPPAAREGAAEEGEGDAPESSDDEDDGSSNRHGNDAALAFELPSDPPPSIRRQPQEGDGGREPRVARGAGWQGCARGVKLGRSRWRWRSEGREGRGWMGFVWDSRRHTLRIDVSGH